MARKQRKQRGAEWKARVAVEAERRTVGELATHIRRRSTSGSGVAVGRGELFADGRSQKAAAQQQAQEAELYEQIGRLKMELEWLKKLLSEAEGLRELVHRGHPWLSVYRPPTAQARPADDRGVPRAALCVTVDARHGHLPQNAFLAARHEVLWRLSSHCRPGN